VAIKICHPGNKPNVFADSVLKAGSHFSGTATQKLELFLILPQLVADKIQADDQYWNVYLCLRDICDIVLAPVIHREDVDDLQELVSDFLKSFIDVFGVHNLKPKFHYLLHYPRMIRLFGPLRNFWCMRFEGKHQYFKQVASNTNCFKNIGKTLAKRHQLRQAWEWIGNDLLLATDRAVSKSKSICVTVLPQDVQDILLTKTGDLDPSEKIASVRSALIDNVEISTSRCYVVDRIGADNAPVFLHVRHIVNIRHNWFMCGYLLYPQLFNKHLHAYCIRKDKYWAVVKPDDSKSRVIVILLD
jgi:hypothetical protein